MARIYTRLLAGATQTQTTGSPKTLDLVVVPATASYTAVVRTITVVGRDSARNAGNIYVSGIEGYGYGAVAVSVFSWAWTFATLANSVFPYWSWSGHVPIPVSGRLTLNQVTGYGTVLVGGWILDWPTPTPTKNAPWPASTPH